MDLSRGKITFYVYRGILEKDVENQALVVGHLKWSSGSWQNGLVRPPIPEDSEDHSCHLPADVSDHIHVMQTFGCFLFVIAGATGSIEFL